MGEFFANTLMVILIIVLMCFLPVVFVTVTDKGISLATKVVKFDDGKFAVRMYVVSSSGCGWQFLYKYQYSGSFGLGALYDDRKFNTKKEADNLLIEFKEWHKKESDKGRPV